MNGVRDYNALSWLSG